ncbi:MAG: hypothetical protein CMK49_02075 [Prochlorococcus sp. SP3034]|nr:hypothetical protein [Prochlorococcus sp. SP3034]
MNINFRKIIDNILVFNFFIVIIFAIYFLFAVIMQLNGVFIYIYYFNKFWNPLIVPLITILIIGTLINGINSWLKNKLHSQEEDI